MPIVSGSVLLFWGGSSENKAGDFGVLDLLGKGFTT